MQTIVDFLRHLSFASATAWFTLLNSVVLGASLLFGAVLLRLPARRVSPPPPPLTLQELALAAVTTVLNTVVTLTGWWLWMRGLVRFREDLRPLAVLADLLYLLIVMDAAMYLLHRLAHHPRIYPLLHALHHTYEHPRPLTLFVLNPAETLSFGALWIAVIACHEVSWTAMVLYLTLNTAFGIIGHLGVEPFPASWKRHPVLKLVATSGFHAGHHQRRGENFGFYSSVWDRLFGTFAECPEES